MKSKVITAIFLLIIFSIGACNALTAFNASKPILKECRHISDRTTKWSVEEAINKTESIYTDDFVGKYQFIEINGATKRVLGNWESNERYKFCGNYLVQASDELDVTNQIASVANLNNYLTAQKIPFLYISFPNKVRSGSDELRPGIMTNSNKNVDKLLAGLQGKGVEYYDIREDYGRDHKDWQSGFFQTDHHWTPETAFWAYTDIATRLNEDYGIKIDEETMTLENYQLKTYKKQYLGSAGRRTGRAFSGLDDFTILLPKFDTNMTVESPDENAHRSGEFKDVMFQKKYLKRDYFNSDTYNIYNGDYDINIEKNETAVNDMKVLLLRDSYSLPLQPYYSFLFKEIHILDLRSIDDFTLKEYIEKSNPDMVIMQYSPGMISQDALWEFGL